MKTSARLTSIVLGISCLLPFACAQADGEKRDDFLSRWESSLTPVCNLIGRAAGLEEFVYKQIGPSLVYIPASLLSYPLKPQTSKDVRAGRQKAGGFIKGVCHAGTNHAQIKAAGIEWNRCDIPFPFDASGNRREAYARFKEKLKSDFVDKGIRIMAVTPYPREFIEFGVDPRIRENERRVKEIAVFLLQDLQGLVGALQITNEMGVPRFTLPLTTEEAVRFMGLQLEAVHPVRGDVLVGYNSAGPQVDVHRMMKPYHRYCDYVGIDIYIGCFTSLGSQLGMYDVLLAYLWSFTGKPVLLCEFGYISGGKPKTPEEKRAVLERYGVSDEVEARRNIREVVDRLPRKMRDYVRRNASGDQGNFLFNSDFKDHLYSELPADVVIPGYPHTPEGQADFYRDLLLRLMRKPYLLGVFIYCYGDSPRCYVCGQEDCPIETRWGLTTVDGKEKPAYDAVRQAFAP